VSGNVSVGQRQRQVPPRFGTACGRHVLRTAEGLLAGGILLAGGLVIRFLLLGHGSLPRCMYPRGRVKSGQRRLIIVPVIESRNQPAIRSNLTEMRLRLGQAAASDLVTPFPSQSAVPAPDSSRRRPRSHRPWHGPKPPGPRGTY